MSSTPDDLSQPLFTREALLAVETVLARHQPANTDTDPAHRMVVFHGEREWHEAKRAGTPGEFLCAVPGTIPFYPPHRDAVQANARWQALDEAWETGPARAYLGSLVTHGQPAAMATVDKVFGFGLGPICAAQPSGGGGGFTPINMPDLHLAEHMALLSIAHDIARLRRQPVAVYAADPLYTSECKTALRAMGIEVIGGYGAVGLTQVDDRSVVVTKYPSFPVRQILADFCRPVVFVGNREKTRDEVAALSEEEQKGPLDPDTERTRRMMAGYEGQRITASPLKDQWWYGRK